MHVFQQAQGMAPKLRVSTGLNLSWEANPQDFKKWRALYKVVPPSYKLVYNPH